MTKLRLGEILVVHGALIQSQLDGMLAIQPKTDMLIESGAAAPDQVMAGLELQRRMEASRGQPAP